MPRPADRKGRARAPRSMPPAEARCRLNFRAREKCLACQHRDNGVCRQILRNLRPHWGVVALNAESPRIACVTEAVYHPGVMLL